MKLTSSLPVDPIHPLASLPHQFVVGQEVQVPGLLHQVVLFSARKVGRPTLLLLRVIWRKQSYAQIERTKTFYLLLPIALLIGRQNRVDSARGVSVLYTPTVKRKERTTGSSETKVGSVIPKSDSVAPSTEPK